MAFNPTDEQRKAINERGNILVSAAAGSGKTAVLVERVMRMLTDPDNPVSADRLLIVTFTNAAAAEMRSRIEKRLYEECAKRPQDIGLKKQKYLISSAKICTIDSFCIDLVRENFDRLGVNPDFKISDSDNLEALSERAINRIIRERLEENSEALKKLLELTGCEYDEKKLAEAVKTIFTYSMLTPFPDSFLDSLAISYKSDFDSNNSWYSESFKIAKEAIIRIKEQISKGYDAALSLGDEGAKYADFFDILSDSTEKLSESLTLMEWDLFASKLSDFVMPSLSSSRKLSGRPEITAIKQIKENILKEKETLIKIFSLSKAEITKQSRELSDPVSLLIELVKEYRTALFEAQREENSLTFYNTEQMAISLLCEEKNGEICLREDASIFFERFDEVLVDEYQDVNDLQDMLFFALSNREKNLFAVGDVKQSIYGFRGANPNNFLNKKKRYVPFDSACDGEPKKIILANNFRSRSEVCEYINFFFKNVMTTDTGKISYNSEEELVATAEFAEIDFPAAEMCLIDNIKESADDRLTIEADAIAMQIKRIMSSGDCIHTKERGLRPAKFSDFAILLRSTATGASKIAAELEKQGIPVNYAADSFIDRLEVETLLSLLQIIDNPGNDIALITVMLSPIFGFTLEELAKIRANSPYGDFISAIAAMRGENPHIEDFYKSLYEYRSFAAIMPLGALVFKLINITGYADIVSSMPDGVRRKANLLKVAEQAAKYEENSGDGISGFLNYIKKIAGENMSSAKVNSGSDSVQIMSIHASKGLQFPVCILANIDSRFNMRDTTDSMLFSQNTGIGFRYYNERDKKQQDTLPRILISNEMKNKTLEEELRLLYVAMTRAEDRLVIVGAYNNLQKKLIDLSGLILSDGGNIGYSSFFKAGAAGDWLLSTALLHPDGEILRSCAEVDFSPQRTFSRLKIKIIDVSGIEKSENTSDTRPAFSVNEEITEQIRNNLAYSYPYEALRSIESKASVSAIANKAESDKFAFSALPAFMERGGMGAAAKGTAIHKVMEFIDFRKNISVNDEIERLKEWEYISEAEAENVDISAIEAFFADKIFERILNSDDLRREMRFLTEIPAGRLDPALIGELANEKIVVQGAVDLCFKENDGIILLDFKSDRVTDEKSLIEAYSEQLKIYAEACEKIFSLPVKEKIIYSFALGKCIFLDNNG